MSFSSNSAPIAIEYNRAPVWESAFKIAEAPMSYLNKLQNTHGSYGNCFEKLFFESPTSFIYHGEQFLDGLKHRELCYIKYSLRGFVDDIKDFCIHLYEKKHLAVIISGTAIAYPSTLALTPVSIIADIFSGVIQAGLRLCQGADKDEIKSILHKKVIASPVQQGMYFLTGTTLLSVMCGAGAWQAALLRVASFSTAFAIHTLFWSAIFGNAMYCSNQGLTAEILPRFFRPDGYNIFIEGGSTDGFGKKTDFDYETTYQAWRNKTEQARKAKVNTRNAKVNTEVTFEFAKVKTKTEKELMELKESGVSSSAKFDKIRVWFNGNKPTYELFGFASLDEVNDEKLKSEFKSLALRYHPDKNKGDEKEAIIWFNLIKEARLDVETLKKTS